MEGDRRWRSSSGRRRSGLEAATMLCVRRVWRGGASCVGARGRLLLGGEGRRRAGTTVELGGDRHEWQGSGGGVSGEKGSEAVA
jgi:hypothetical protein